MTSSIEQMIQWISLQGTSSAKRGSRLTAAVAESYVVCVLIFCMTVTFTDPKERLKTMCSWWLHFKKAQWRYPCWSSISNNCNLSNVSLWDNWGQSERLTGSLTCSKDLFLNWHLCRHKTANTLASINLNMYFQAYHFKKISPNFYVKVLILKYSTLAMIMTGTTESFIITKISTWWTWPGLPMIHTTQLYPLMVLTLQSGSDILSCPLDAHARGSTSSEETGVIFTKLQFFHLQKQETFYFKISNTVNSCISRKYYFMIISSPLKEQTTTDQRSWWKVTFSTCTELQT